MSHKAELELVQFELLQSQQSNNDKQLEIDKLKQEKQYLERQLNDLQQA